MIKPIHWLFLFHIFLLSAHAKTGDFPCDLGSFPVLPTITLSGENHSDAFCNVDKTMHVLEAAEGKYFIGLEALFPEQPNKIQPFCGVDPKQLTDRSRVFGYDALFPYGLGVLLSLHTSVMSEIQSHAGSKEEIPDEPHPEATNLIGLFADNPYLQKAWKQLRSKTFVFKDAKDEELAKVFDVLVESPEQDIDKFVAGKSKVLSRKNTINLINILKEMTGSYVEMAKSPEYKVSMMVPDNIDYANDCFKGVHVIEAIDELIVKWRNLHMAKNIADLYCKAAKEGKELFIISGALHVPGLKALIDEMSKRKIKIKTRDPVELLKDFDQLNKLNSGDIPGFTTPETLSCGPDPFWIEQGKDNRWDGSYGNEADQKEGLEWAKKRAEDQDVKLVVEILEDAKEKIFPHPEKAKIVVKPQGWGLEVSLQYPEADLPPLPKGSILEIYEPGNQIAKQIEKEMNFRILSEMATPGLRFADDPDPHFQAVKISFFAPTHLNFETP